MPEELDTTTPEIEREEDFQMPKQKRCDQCEHASVCGAYNAFEGVKEKFEQRFQYIGEFPAKGIALATMCKEYKEKTPGETVNQYECSGCTDRDGL